MPTNGPMSVVPSGPIQFHGRVVKFTGMSVPPLNTVAKAAPRKLDAAAVVVVVVVVVAVVAGVPVGAGGGDWVMG